LTLVCFKTSAARSASSASSRAPYRSLSRRVAPTGSTRVASSSARSDRWRRARALRRLVAQDEL